MTYENSNTTAQPACVSKVKILLPILILLVAAIASYAIFTSKPKAKKQKPAPKPPLVEVLEVKRETHPVTLSAMGTVTAPTRAELKARVAGEVVWISENLEPGSRIQKGEPLVRLDRVDLGLALATAEARLQQAQADFDLEKGQQDVAENELALMEATTGRKVADRDLVLRKPQLAKAKANLNLARVEVDRAKIDLSRSTIVSPFNALVISRSAPLGSLATSGQTVAEITDESVWWVEATLPVSDLAWIDLNPAKKELGNEVTITSGKATYRGRLLRLQSELGAGSRMARILIEIEDPMGQASRQGATPLLLGSYVKTSITGTPMTSVIGIPERAVRDGGRVWIKKGGKLRIREINVLRREGDMAYINGAITPGDKIILTQITTPVDGMTVREKGEELPQEPQKKGKGKGGKR